MRRTFLLTAILCLVASGVAQNTTSTRAQLARLPLSFEPNRGQTDSEAVFVSHLGGGVLFLTTAGAVLKIGNHDGAGKSALSPRPPEVLSLKLEKPNAAAKISAEQPLPGVSNYLIGNDPAKWHTAVPQFARVRYSDIYPGVDLVYYGNGNHLEYDFVVKPGADPAKIAWKVEGAVMKKNAGGAVQIAARMHSLEFQAAQIYQTINGERRQITGSYVLRGDTLAFEVGPYDHSRELVIDPVLSFSTYLGGSSNDRMNGIAVDKTGNVYVAGRTESVDYPVLHNIQTYSGGRDVAVTKFNPTGSALIYSTFVGGTSDEIGRGIAIDASGNAYVVGDTFSSNFPTTVGAFQVTYAGDTTGLYGDGFAFKLNSGGNAFVYSTFIGGSGGDELSGAALDASGNLYSAVITNSTNFPVTPGAFQTTNPNLSLLTGGALKLNATGTALVFSTYLGGSGPGVDAAYTVVIDSSNNVYVVGMTGSPNFPTTAGAFDITCGTDGNCNALFDGFVTKLNSRGSALVFSTFIGGSSGDAVTGIALDSAKNVYLYGGTDSTDFPITPGSAQPIFGGASAGCNPATFACGDNFILKLNPQGSALVYSTYLGGSGDENYSQIEGMKLDANNNAWVVGETDSVDFPLANAVQAAYGGGTEDAFVTELNSTGSQFLFSTYLGGNSTDYGTAIAIDTTGNAYVTGATSSANFITTPGAFQTQCGTDGTCNGGLLDAFVTKFKLSADLSVTNSAPRQVTTGGTITYTIVVTNGGTDQATTVQMSDTTPTGTTFSSVSTTSGSCTAPVVGGTGTVKCQAASLASGANFTVTLVLNVTAPSGSTITDKAQVTSKTFDPNLTNNSATARTRVN